MFLPYEKFSYTDSWRELQMLYTEVNEMSDDALVDECRYLEVGRNKEVSRIIDRYEAYGFPLSALDRDYLIDYYKISHVEEALPSPPTTTTNHRLGGG